MLPGIKNIFTTGGGQGEFYNAYLKAAEITDSIISLPLSKVLSASYNSSVAARELILAKRPDLNIQVVDSKNSVGALGLIALETARAAQAGKNLAEVKKVAEEMVSQVKHLSVPESLSFFIKIGRAPKGAEEDEKAGVKAILGISNNGSMEFVGKESEINTALDKMVDLVPKYADISKTLHVVVTYSNDPSHAERIIERVKSKYNILELFVTECTPVMIAAVGPITYLCYYSG